MNAPKPITLITGATEGIGRALALEFAGRGHDLFLVARSGNALSRLEDEIATMTEVTVISNSIDLTIPQDRESILQSLAEHNCYVEILANNAGLGLCNPFIKHDPAELRALIDLNITALTTLSHMFLPDMVARKRGGILNIASLGGLVPGPYQAAYYASKAYVISLTEALAREVAGSSVHISVVVPGPVNTEFHNKMGAGNAFYLRALGVMDPHEVARSAIRGFRMNRTVIAPGFFNTLSALALRILPHTISVPIIGWLLKPRPGSHKSSPQDNTQ